MGIYGPGFLKADWLIPLSRESVNNNIFYFMLCQSSFLSTVISFVCKDKWWFDESMSVIFCMKNI